MRRLGCTLLCLAVLAATPTLADDKLRVVGADLFVDGADMDHVYARLAAAPLSQAEIDLFTGSMPAIEKWVAASPENREAWNAIDEEDDRFVSAVRKLPAWKAEGVTIEAREFLAMISKLEVGLEVAEDGTEGILADLDEQLTEIRAALEDDEVDPEERSDLEHARETVTLLRDGLKNYPAENTALVRKNEAAIESALMTFYGLRDDMEEDDDEGDDGMGG